MRKILTILIAFCFYFTNASGCSCAGYNSYAQTTSYIYNYLEGIIEFKVLSNSEHSIKVKIVKVWKGDYVENQELEIWNYTDINPTSCGPPAIDISSFNLNERYIASLRKKAGEFGKTYDAEGQLFVPSSPCGEPFLRVAQDSVKGATFGKSNRTPSELSTLEFNLPYDEFNTRFAAQLSIVLGSENSDYYASVHIFPNPTTHSLHLNGVIGNVKIIDSFGCEILNTEAKETIDVSSIKNGIYFIEIALADRKIRKKFVKE